MDLSSQTPGTFDDDELRYHATRFVSGDGGDGQRHQEANAEGREARITVGP